MILLNELISKIDGFTYWNVYDDITLHNISDIQLSSNKYEVTNIMGDKHSKIIIFVKEIKE